MPTAAFFSPRSDSLFCLATNNEVGNADVANNDELVDGAGAVAEGDGVAIAVGADAEDDTVEHVCVDADTDAATKMAHSGQILSIPCFLRLMMWH